ncbi:MAG: DNA translocase FtsK [Acidaminococcaceae bacterium]|nr:DNA translocase FtsK [Acidaminococcaceae bacterium]
MLASLVLTGKLSVAALTAKAGDKIQDIRSARRERRNMENDSEESDRYVPGKQEPRPFFGGTDTEERKSSPLDVYNKDEFADFNDDVRKPSAFKKILNFGQKALDRNTDGTDPENTRPDGTGSGNYVPVERMANHDKTEKERPSLIKIYPEQQETRVLRPASGIITGHTDNPEPAPWEKGAIIPGQEFQEPSVTGNGEETPAGTEMDHELPVPDEVTSGKPRFILTPNGVTRVTDGSVKSADEKEKVSENATAGSASNKEMETGHSDAEKETEQKKEEYIFPPLELLNPVKKTNRRQFDSDVREQCRKLEQTLADFRVNAKVTGVTRGPSVTRYELEPAPGVKVSSVVNLADDIALRLAAPGVRVEAPIPGKAAIGIEAPNVTNDMVSFREIVDCEDVRKSSSKLCVGLGKDIEGKVITIDLAKMPHLLVAGTTGSGKSVCVNTLLAGIMYKARPDEVKLILVDPKVVELTNYNGIPHLLVPVVTDAKKAASALHWAVAEMERRYKSFADTRVRDIKAYNAQAEEKMPYIVIVIDEMSDLMMVATADVEDAILRLAQKARACGIHMVLATQRPSVDVITGIVKANIPSRIAFAVSSLTDSRTILDMGGAEKLLGKGDMLYYPIGANKPSRVQGAFVSDEELNRVTDFIKQQAIPVEYSDEVTNVVLPSDSQKEAKNAAAGSGDAQEEQGQDELLDDAIRLVLDLGQASASMLQRRFRIGYNRAARLVEAMEELGIVGPAIGSKPRELKMSRDEVEYKFLQKDNFSDSQ